MVNIIHIFVYKNEGIDINKTSATKECMLCHYWYFKNISRKFEPYVCNICYNVLMTTYELKNITVLNVKVVDYRSVLWAVSKNEVVNILNNSVLKDEVLLLKDFGANKTPVEVIKEGAFGGTYFRGI